MPGTLRVTEDAGVSSDPPVRDRAGQPMGHQCCSPRARTRVCTHIGVMSTCACSYARRLCACSHTGLASICWPMCFPHICGQSSCLWFCANVCSWHLHTFVCSQLCTHVSPVHIHRYVVECACRAEAIPHRGPCPGTHRKLTLERLHGGQKDRTVGGYVAHTGPIRVPSLTLRTPESTKSDL